MKNIMETEQEGFDQELSMSYFRKDSNLLKKAGIFYALFVLTCIFSNTHNTLLILLSLVIDAILCGCYIENTHTRIFKPESKLIEWRKRIAFNIKGTTNG